MREPDWNLLHVDLIALLLIRGARPDAPMRNGRTPADVARQLGHWAAAELIEAWQSPPPPPPRPAPGTPPDMWPGGIETRAHRAVELLDLELLRELLDGGADIEDPDEYGSTLLHHAADLEGVAAVQADETGHVDITAFLLARGADSFARGYQGGTPLETAQIFGNWLAVELIEAWQQRRAS